MLLNVLRGSATSGLAGMAAARGRSADRCSASGGPRRARSAPRLRLAPVHDPMNDDLQFRRVWLRREVIPRLERDARRDLVEVLARQADCSATTTSYLDALAAGAGRSGAPLDGAALAAAPLALARRAVRLWLGRRRRPLERRRGARRSRAANDAPSSSRAARRVERVAGRLHLARSDGGHAGPGAAGRCRARARFGPFVLEAWIEHGPPVGLARRPRTSRCSTPTGSVRRSACDHRTRAIGSARSGGARRCSSPMRCARRACPPSARAARPIVVHAR